MIMMNHFYSETFLPPNTAPDSSEVPETSTSPQLSKYQVSVPVAILDNYARAASNDLVSGCEPRDQDIVCGRGKGSYNRPGNVVFRKVIRMHIQDYLTARTKFEKTTVLNRVIDHLHTEEHARFLKFNDKTKQWFEITDDQAREKVGHTMRETIASMDNIQPCEKKRTDLLASQKAIFEAMLRSSPSTSSRKKTTTASVTPSTSSVATTPIQYRMPWDDDDEQLSAFRTEV